MKTCDMDGCTEPATSRTAKYCIDCRKIRQSENGTVQGKANANKGWNHPGPIPPKIDHTDGYVPPRTSEVLR